MNDSIHDPRIDAAIESVPLADIPPDLVANAVRQAKPHAPAPKFSFSISFLDVSIGAFLATFFTTLLIAVRWLFSTIDPLYVQRLHLELSWLFLRLTPVKTAAYSAVIGLSVAFVLVVFMTAVHFSNTPKMRPAR